MRSSHFFLNSAACRAFLASAAAIPAWYICTILSTLGFSYSIFTELVVVLAAAFIFFDNEEATEPAFSNRAAVASCRVAMSAVANQSSPSR
ncbi:hypothetical protein F4808DRAFT_421089 [Astrocystis sublimbata]|nr:hypothetical protein F4808DRAFT_421089 [Astrocystis sublimbata]